MHLVTFSDASGTRIGVLETAQAQIVDLSRSAPDLPRELAAFIAAGEAALARARDVQASPTAARVPLASARLLAPFPRPTKNIVCVGKNYHEHAKEFHSSGFDATAGKSAIPDVPIFFTKAPTCVSGPEDAIPAHLDPTASVDYEGELTVVIGRGGRNVSKARAFEHVFGYTLINDVTSRTLQGRHKQWFLGKSFDGFCPMGPAVVTADEVPEVGKLRLQTRVNGELRQDAPVSDLIFDIPTLIETLSAVMTLEPGDLIATGTCAGVGIGFNPPKYLQRGDRVEIRIDPIGVLGNPVD